MNLFLEHALAMRVIRLVLCVAGLLSIFGAGWILGEREIGRVHAQTNVTVPKAWGTLKTMSLNLYVFEAADGTIRLVDYQTGKVQAVASRR